MNVATLYKQKDGTMRVWRVWTNDNKVHMEYGVEGGAKTNNVEVCSPTGKRSAAQQAESRAISRYNYQIKKKGYCQDRAAAEADTFAKLPKPNRYKNKASKLTLPCDIQPKLNGTRIEFVRSTGRGRTWGHEDQDLHAALKMELVTLCAKVRHTPDGELYKHGYALSTINSIRQDLEAQEKHGLEFHIFDIVAPGIEWSDRKKVLQEMEQLIAELNFKFVKICHCDRVDSLEEGDAVHKKNTMLGYEGSVYRTDAAGYEMDKRMSTILKRKDFMHREYKVLDLLPSDDGGAVAVCETELGKPFRCNMEGKKEILAEKVRNKHLYVPGWLTVRFQELSIYGIPTILTGEDIRTWSE